MRTKLVLGLGALSVLAFACAKATLVDDGTDMDSGMNPNGDGGSCAFNTLTDPKHCGSCANACAIDQVCSMGTCKAQCDPPTSKCASDAGVICADLKMDPQHCGSCTKACANPDAGSMAPGTNNPEASVPYDGGPGWSYGSPTCTMGACGIACNGGMTACSDNLCYDTQNHHDHCGNCNTACAMDEWCNKGTCCTTDKLACNGMCIDVLSDTQNCGACGNVCSGNTPYCSQGKCVAACIPAGSRVAYNTMVSHTTSGCWNGNPCAQGTYTWTSTNGQSFINANEEVVCGGTTACVNHIGITTYELSANCQGSWDVYCDATKVGTIDTSGKACQGNAMNNTCSIQFNPLTCKQIKFVGKTGSGNAACCGSVGLHSMITGTAAW